MTPSEIPNFLGVRKEDGERMAKDLGAVKKDSSPKSQTHPPKNSASEQNFTVKVPHPSGVLCTHPIQAKRCVRRGMRPPFLWPLSSLILVWLTYSSRPLSCERLPYNVFAPQLSISLMDRQIENGMRYTMFTCGLYNIANHWK